MTESKDHKTCKNNLADLLGGETEVSMPDGRRVDVVDQCGNKFEIECNRDSDGNMKCYVETPKKQKIDCDCINDLADSIKE